MRCKLEIRYNSLLRNGKPRNKGLFVCLFVCGFVRSGVCRLYQADYRRSFKLWAWRREPHQRRTRLAFNDASRYVAGEAAVFLTDSALPSDSRTRWTNKPHRLASAWELRTGLKYEQISRAPSTTSTCEWLSEISGCEDIYNAPIHVLWCYVVHTSLQGAVTAFT